MRPAPYIHERGAEIDDEIERLENEDRDDAPLAFHRGRKAAIDWVRNGDDGFRSNEAIRTKAEEKRREINQARSDGAWDEHEHAHGMYEAFCWVLRVEDVRVRNDGSAEYVIDEQEYAPAV